MSSNESKLFFEKMVANNFVVGVCVSSKYADIKSEVSRLSNALKIQFDNSRKEFTSEYFLDSIKNKKGGMIV